MSAKELHHLRSPTENDVPSVQGMSRKDFFDEEEEYEEEDYKEKDVELPLNYIEENIQGSIIKDRIYRIVKKEDISDINIKNFGDIKNYKNLYVSDDGNIFTKIVRISYDEDGDEKLLLSEEKHIFNPVLEICVNVYNIPVPENEQDMINIFIKPSLQSKDKFIDYYNKVKELIKNIAGRIVSGNFMAKSTKIFAQYTDKLDDYYDICNKIKRLFKDEKFPANLYRSIKQIDGYNPILFNVGDEIPNIFPISASMEFEFPAYLWTMPKQYCCLLSINIDDLYSCSIPIVEYNSGVMYENLYSHKNTEYQSEINLKPGIFFVREISDIVLPSLSEYKNLLYRMYDEIGAEEEKKMVQELVCRHPESTRCTKPDVIRVIYVDYRPYTKLELTKEMFNKFNKNNKNNKK